jgi:hypothetical protein
MATEAKFLPAPLTDAPRVVGRDMLAAELVEQVTASFAAHKKSFSKVRAGTRSTPLSTPDLADHALIETAVLNALTALAGHRTTFMIFNTPNAQLEPVMLKVLEQAADAVQARRKALTERQIEALADVYMVNDPLAVAMPDIEADNAKAQAHYLQTVPHHTAEVLADLAGHGSKNRSATASRWKAARQIFGVRYAGREVYPAFQFKDRAPRPVIGQALEALPADMSSWQIAFWFAGANGWLGGACPMDRLDQPEAVVAAARHEGEDWVG